ncbi:MAG: cytochrome c [Myxococcales bacterium]|nr:cytochrome c [Myxococcales bacterium]
MRDHLKRFVLALIVALGGPALADPIAQLYSSKCKNCHGLTGKGDTKVGRKEKIPDMTAEQWQAGRTDEDIRRKISEGSKERPKMKPFKGKLSAQEIDGLVQYIRSLAKVGE